MEESISRIMNKFADLTGLPCSFYPAKKTQSGEYGHNACAFCTEIYRYDSGRFMCNRQIRSALNRAINQKTWQFFYCHTGLVEIVAPVYERGEMMGYFLAGGFGTRRDVSILRTQSRQVEQKYHIADERFPLLIDELDVRHRRQIEPIGELLFALIRLEIDMGKTLADDQIVDYATHFYDDAPIFKPQWDMSDFLTDSSITQEEMQVFWGDIDTKMEKLYACIKCRHAVEGKELWRQVLALAYREKRLDHVRTSLTMLMEIMLAKFYMKDAYDPRYYAIHYRVVSEIWSTDDLYAFKGIMSDCYDEIFNMFCNDERLPDVTMLDRALHFIQNNYNCSISISDVARAVRLTPAYISRKFAREMGTTLKGYIVGLRMEKAKELLTNTTLPIAEIAQRVGYQNLRSFHKMFTQHFNMTCGELRQKYGK